MFTGAGSWWHWVVLLIVVVVLFGSKKLPEAARGLGRSMRIFKSEMAEMTKDGEDSAKVDVEAPREITDGKTDVDVNVTVSDQNKKSA